MTRDRIDVDAALEQLRNELSIAPPPHFENRVRARVSNLRRADRSLVRPVLVRRADRSLVRRISTHALAAVLVVAAASFGRGVWLVSTTLDSMPTLTSRSQIALARTAPSAWSPRSLDRGITFARPASSDGSPRSSGRIETFEVLVPPDQARAIAALLGRLRAPQSDTIPAATDPIVPVPELTLIQVTPIQIEPLPAPSAGRPERNLP